MAFISKNNLGYFLLLYLDIGIYAHANNGKLNNINHTNGGKYLINGKYSYTKFGNDELNI